MKHLQNAIELPDAWERTGITQWQYESNAAVRRLRKHESIVRDAKTAINKARKRIGELRLLAKSRRELIPVIAVKIVSLGDNSIQLDWELKLALDSDDISPWNTVVFYTQRLRIDAAVPLE